MCPCNDLPCYSTSEIVSVVIIHRLHFKVPFCRNLLVAESVVVMFYVAVVFCVVAAMFASGLVHRVCVTTWSVESFLVSTVFYQLNCFLLTC